MAPRLSIATWFRVVRGRPESARGRTLMGVSVECVRPRSSRLARACRCLRSRRRVASAGVRRSDTSTRGRGRHPVRAGLIDWRIPAICDRRESPLRLLGGEGTGGPPSARAAGPTRGAAPIVSSTRVRPPWTRKQHRDLAAAHVAKGVRRAGLAGGGIAIRGIETAARSVQFAAWVNPTEADYLYRWFDRLDAQSGTTKALGCLRVGAAALLAGCISLALTVAFELPDLDLDSVVGEHLESEAVADHEMVRSSSYNYVLGDDPQDALQEFARFARDCLAAVPSNGS
jgi:hypothetical protein